DAKRRISEIAREVWRDRELADRLEDEVRALRARFDEAFWSDARGGFYALALDGDKRRVDSACSNMVHVSWTGIVPPDPVDAGVGPAGMGRRRAGPAAPDPARAPAGSPPALARDGGPDRAPVVGRLAATGRRPRVRPPLGRPAGRRPGLDRRSLRLPRNSQTG